MRWILLPRGASRRSGKASRPSRRCRGSSGRPGKAGVADETAPVGEAFEGRKVGSLPLANQEPARPAASNDSAAATASPGARPAGEGSLPSPRSAAGRRKARERLERKRDVARGLEPLRPGSSRGSGARVRSRPGTRFVGPGKLRRVFLQDRRHRLDGRVAAKRARLPESIS